MREGRRKGARAREDHCGHLAVEGVSGDLQAESSRIFCTSEFEICVGPACGHDGDVTGPAENMKKGFAYLETKKGVEILTHQQRRKLVRACWRSDGYRRRRHVGARTGHIWIVRAVDVEVERLPSIDESPARETD